MAAATIRNNKTDMVKVREDYAMTGDGQVDIEGWVNQIASQTHLKQAITALPPLRKNPASPMTAFTSARILAEQQRMT